MSSRIPLSSGVKTHAHNAPQRNGLSACVAAVVGLIWAVFPAVAEAHPISLTQALVDVSEGRIEVRIDVLVEDLVLYYGLPHDGEFRVPRTDIEAQAEEHRAFLEAYVQLRDEEGRRLEGQVVEVDLAAVGEDGVHMDDLMAHSIVYDLVFPLERKPEHLTVYQNLDGDNPRIPAEMEVYVFREGARIDGPVTLSHGTAHTTEVDWQAEVEEGRTDLEDIQAEIEAEGVEDFGLTSYSTVYGYIYITETDVRHELLIPLLTLERWVPIEREQEGRITVAEQEAAREDVFRFMQEQNAVWINGNRVEPELDRIEFFGPGMRDFAEQAPQRPLSVYNTRVGVILEFPAEQVPAEVHFEWHYFDEHLPYFRPTAYTYDGESHDVLFDPYLTEWEWAPDEVPQRAGLSALSHPDPAPHLAIPLFSLAAGAGAILLAVVAAGAGPGRRRWMCAAVAGGLLAGAFAGQSVAVKAVAHPFESEVLAEADAKQTFAALHENIYRAFERRDEHRIYDALEQSVAGPLLEEMYLQIRRGLTMEQQGNAIARIETVEIEEATRRRVEGSSPAHQAFEFTCTWTVTGTVEHWAHVHTRTNRYKAVFTMEGLLDRGWRITSFRPLQEERVQIRTELREDWN